jgi:hypothetical protein
MDATLTVRHQGVDLGHGNFFSHRGEVEIDRGSLERTVSHVFLDLAEVDAGFQKMGGVAMS